MRTIVVAGIGTGVGKTVVSAILVEALNADYWKPIQAGDLEKSDTLIVQDLVSNTQSVFHKETYHLSNAMSPHAASKLDGIEIKSEHLTLPKTENILIVELAGGLMVPLNSEELNLDLLKTWKTPVVLVSKNYLGSINHTLLSLEALRANNIAVAGIIFNGEHNRETEELILNYTKVKFLGRVPELHELTKNQIKKIAENLKVNFQDLHGLYENQSAR